jgi:hypothetical protein
VSFRALAFALLGQLVGQLAAQAGNEVMWCEVPGANATAVAVLWQHGLDDDEPSQVGACRVLAECRLERARAVVPAIAVSGMQVCGDATLVFASAASSQWPQLAAFLRALLDDALPMQDDELSLLIARAALAADTAEFLDPGPVLQTRLRLRLCRGTRAARPVAGSAPAMAALTPAQVRGLLQVPVAVQLGVLGAIPPELRRAISLPERAVHARKPESTAEAAVAVVQNAIEYETHSRVDSPFVAVGFRAPRSDLLPAFALGIEVARARTRRLPVRFGQAMGRAPIVGWSWLHGDPVVVFCRRGADFVQLRPGEHVEADMESARDATIAELESILQNLRQQPPTARELADARSALQLELALQPLTPDKQSALAGSPAALPGRLQVLLLGACHGIDKTALEAVTREGVTAVLASVLDPAGACWHGLMPVPRSDVGWTRR